MRPRAGSWFPCSPQLSSEQAANHVVVSRVGTDVGERTPMARHCNSHLTYSTPALWPVTVPPRISSNASPASRSPHRHARVSSEPTIRRFQRSERMKQAWMGSVAVATAMLCVVPGLVQAQEDITVTDKSFGCIRDGTKVRNTYIRNADPQRLAEAQRILRDRVANTEYPVGTFLQLVPGEAMV